MCVLFRVRVLCCVLRGVCCVVCGVLRVGGDVCICCVMCCVFRVIRVSVLRELLLL